MLSTKIKAILVAVAVGLVAYSYVWTYHQGQKTCKSAVLEAQITALQEELVRQENEFRDQREAEMRAAAEVAKQLDNNERNHQAALVVLRKKLDEAKQARGTVCIVPTDVVRVLNGSRRASTPETSG